MINVKTFFFFVDISFTLVAFTDTKLVDLILIPVTAEWMGRWSCAK